MRYRIQIPGFSKQRIEIEPGGLLSRPRLWGDDQIVLRDPKTGRFKLRDDRGGQISAAWKHQAMGFDIPQLEVDGTLYKATEPLPWYVWLWCMLPLALVAVGGLIGAAIGVTAMTINQRIFRGHKSTATKFILAGLVSIGAFILDLIIAGVIMLSRGR